MLSPAALELLRRSAGAFKRPPIRLPEEWALANRRLEVGDSEAGPLDHTRTPYILPIMHAIASRKYHQVVAVMGSQMSKTEAVLTLIGHRLDDDPVPIIYVGPTKEFVTDQVEPRLRSMIIGTPSLSMKLAKGKAEKKVRKIVGGVKLRLAWAGSASQLKSDHAGLAFVDERDDPAMQSVRGQGDPVELVRARGKTYRDNFVLVIFSTPTLGAVLEETHPVTGIVHWGEIDREKVESPVWRLYSEGMRAEWAWPCPECGHYFVPRFSRLKWPKGSTPAEARRDAYVECPDCGARIVEAMKFDLNVRGVYISPGQTVAAGGVVERDGIVSDSASFWVSGLCSPWQTFGDLAQQFLTAVRSQDPDRIQTVINTGFGELYRVAGEAPKWQTVAALRMPYKQGEIPEGVLGLTAGIDAQKRELYYVVLGWRHPLEPWLIAQGELFGETEHEDVWLRLGELLTTPIGGVQIRLAAIDSGYKPGNRWRRPEHQVYAFCRRFPMIARATKGHDTLDRPLKPSLIDVTLGGRTWKQGLQLWHVNSDFFKSWVHGRIAWPKGEPGALHIPEDASDDYCAQLVNESRMVKPSGHVSWVEHGPNHYLDATSLAVAAAYMLGVHVMAARPQPPADASGAAAPAAFAQPQPTSSGPPRDLPQQLRSNWMQR